MRILGKTSEKLPWRNRLAAVSQRFHTDSVLRFQIGHFLAESGGNGVPQSFFRHRYKPGVLEALGTMLGEVDSGKPQPPQAIEQLLGANIIAVNRRVVAAYSF